MFFFSNKCFEMWYPTNPAAPVMKYFMKFNFYLISSSFITALPKSSSQSFSGLTFKFVFHAPFKTFKFIDSESPKID